MRKLAILPAALAALGVAAIPAFAVNADQGLSVSVSPSKAGTKAKPKGVRLKVTTTTTPKDTTPFATTSATIFFDRNLQFYGKSFKSCSQAQVQQDQTRCPAGSKVGTGSAQGIALGATENLTITAFNGPSGNKIELHVVGQQPLMIDSVIEGSLRTSSGAYGHKLVVPIPQGLQQPAPNVYATLTQFVTAVGSATVKSKGKPYVGLTGCTGGKLRFRGDFTYTDGTSKTATAVASCKK
jgi:hypothetical protein